MLPVLSRAQMREFDRHAIEDCRVPGVVLMENAGRGATDVLVRDLLGGHVEGKHVVVVCGTGNNGGDGFVMARHLLARGARVDVFLVGEPSRLSTDAGVMHQAWVGLQGAVCPLVSHGDIAALEAAMKGADAVVDALFGTGLDRVIEGHQAAIVSALNRSSCARFAVDLPSGLDADTGATLGIAVQANATTTFAHSKLGLLTPNGADLAGKVSVVDIGVPASLVSRLGRCAQLLSPADLADWTAARAPGTHKGAAGHVAIVGGLSGRVGAPQLVARGAMRAGAGLATLFTWPEVAGVIEGNILEIMVSRLDPARLIESLDAGLSRKQATVVGPGLGLGEVARAAVQHILASFQGPLVVDADALSIFAGRPEAFRAAGKAILTPHPGELSRLLGRSSAVLEADRFNAARELCAASGAVVVLKGAHTLIAHPDGRLAISPVACPALATAGSGDVLGGIIGALSCRLAPFEAACAGVMMHALAGEAWSRAHGGADHGMLASEMADALPGLLG